jgi:hypothetical protein
MKHLTLPIVLTIIIVETGETVVLRYKLFIEAYTLALTAIEKGDTAILSHI